MADQLTTDPETIREAVRERYAAAATGVSSCCGGDVSATRSRRTAAAYSIDIFHFNR